MLKMSMNNSQIRNRKTTSRNIHSWFAKCEFLNFVFKNSIQNFECINNEFLIDVTRNIWYITNRKGFSIDMPNPFGESDIGVSNSLRNTRSKTYVQTSYEIIQQNVYRVNRSYLVSSIVHWLDLMKRRYFYVIIIYHLECH